MSDDPELDKIAELRAAEWGCTRAEARERLLAEAAAERIAKSRTSGVREQADDSTLFAASAFAAITSIEAGLWDRYLLRLQATIRARLATDEWAQHVRARQEGKR